MPRPRLRAVLIRILPPPLFPLLSISPLAVAVRQIPFVGIMLRFSVVAAACVAVANAYPNRLDAPCGEWQAGVTPIAGGLMGTSVVTSVADKCVVTVEGLSAGSPYEPSKAYKITVTSTMASGVAVSSCLLRLVASPLEHALLQICCG